jgi:hypothetical protein
MKGRAFEIVSAMRMSRFCSLSIGTAMSGMS